LVLGLREKPQGNLNQGYVPIVFFPLSEVFQTPLYSFQRALGRLEKGGVIVSHREGKTLVYQYLAIPAFSEIAAN
jgi:hypothetical protein